MRCRINFISFDFLSDYNYYKEGIQIIIEKWISFNYIYTLSFSKPKKDLDRVSKLKKKFLNLL